MTEFYYYNIIYFECAQFLIEYFTSVLKKYPLLFMCKIFKGRKIRPSSYWKIESGADWHTQSDTVSTSCFKVEK